MLQWNDLHPYNAVHVVRIPQVLDLERVATAVRSTLEHHGLNNLTVNAAKRTFDYGGGSAPVEVKKVDIGQCARLAVIAEIERQLNTAFTLSERFSPFRFFVLAESDCFSLLVVYFHAIADAEALVRLLRDITNAYLRKNESGHSSPVELYPRCYDSLIRHHPALLARKLCEIPGLVRNTRRSCRPRYHDVRNLNNGFTFFSLNPESLLSLIKVGKSWSVTLNDLFLALLMKSLSPMSGDRMHSRRRRRISVGCVVNLKKDLGLDSQSTFGLFLGSFIVTHDVPEGIQLMDLAKDIRRQTFRIKRKRLYLGTSLELGLGGFAFSLFSGEQRKKFYQKHYPLWGGITNMNLNVLWEQSDRDSSIDYLRAVSTGPATPLVLSLTTVGHLMNIGLTYRSTVFSAEEIAQFQQRLLETVTHLESHP